MKAIFVGLEFVLAGVRNSPEVEVLNRADGTAEHYWFSFFTGDFAKAVLPNGGATNQALLWGSAAGLRCAWFTVIG